MAQPLNILYIHSHDTGRYIEPYGHLISTPNLQRLAEQSVVFRQAFCAAPTCSPSRAALLTGQAAHSSGMLGLAHRGFRLHDHKQHILHTLKAAGYFTALAGVQHVFPHDELQHAGYDLCRPDGQAAEVAAVEFLRLPPAQPFFLDVGFFETHRNGRGFSGANNAPGDGDADERYMPVPAPLPDTPETRRDMADYITSAGRLDQKVGLVLDALEESGLARSTLVISTTDHGIAFPGMKCSLTDHGIGVSLMLRAPEYFEGGRVSNALVSQIDVFPTVCDLLGLEHPAWLQGKSLLPVLRGEVEEINDAIFAGVTFHAAFEPKRCVRTKRYKYIRNFGARSTPVLPNCDDSASKDLWLQSGWHEREIAEEELYDLIFDCNETNNLARNSGHAAVLQEMRERLSQWMHDTNDPLLRSEIPLPTPIRVNPAAGMSPNDPYETFSERVWRI